MTSSVSTSTLELEDIAMLDPHCIQRYPQVRRFLIDALSYALWSQQSDSMTKSLYTMLAEHGKDQLSLYVQALSDEDDERNMYPEQWVHQPHQLARLCDVLGCSPGDLERTLCICL